MKIVNDKPDSLFYMLSILTIILFIVLVFGIRKARAEDWLSYTNEQYADAIYTAEGGKKAKVPYGILSVKVKDEAEARRVCINTVRNNRIRFANQTKYTDFVVFLGSRYCPIGAENDPMGLNKNWVKNIKYFLEEQNGL